ncbi:hypothetical protein QA646_27080 (plasmid) [Rhizobium sp. CB3090]|uniref:hypothetical protein n=1 Tax=Rhizobium sp. CB3090 TaxID=3039156 RepID=UPI0024B13B75|nr:hypothetical protein [Rhizobium sp. CB3090]WFU13024.1 hypothetical protein QA646_27080 [Rhizobium sp. CB3090]
MEDILTKARDFGYKCYEYDLIMLKAEMIWQSGQPDDAEQLFDRLSELERETGYKALHLQRMLIQMNQSPLEAYPG